MAVKRIRAIVYGVGAMGTIMTRLLLEKGVEIVGAIGRQRNVGTDLGDVAGVGRRLGVSIDADADHVLRTRAADVVMMSFCSDMDTMYPAARMCAENGMNVVSIANEAFYPWALFPQKSSDLDRIAKANDVTITGTGIQDVIWFGVVSALAGVCHRIDSVSGETSANLNDYGPQVAQRIGVGCSAAEFASRLGESQSRAPTPFGIALQALVADLGFTLASARQSVEPILAAREMRLDRSGQVVQKGSVAGVVEIDEAHTVEGPVLRGTFRIRPYEPGETDYCKWSIKGIPDTCLEIPLTPGQMGTCTIAVNRIPDVIDAEPGFITLDRLPRLRFRPCPLHFHVRH